MDALNVFATFIFCDKIHLITNLYCCYWYISRCYFYNFIIFRNETPTTTIMIMIIIIALIILP